MTQIHPDPHLISVAPMMDYTDRHDRYFLRLIAPDIALYTEMITAQALAHGNPQRLLAFHPDEKYVALQLGGSDPALLAQAAKMGEDFGYNEINLNSGCPSPRVSSGRFGACLMLEPQLVADCMSAMQAQVSIPVTIKCRIGVDHQDDYESLHHYVETIAATGCNTFIVHARKAWLAGLSPKQNREIPPLRYDVVYRLKQDFPGLKIILNGGIKTSSDVDTQLQHVDGVMIGRAAYHNPYLLADLQYKYMNNKDILSRYEIIKKMLPYIHEQLSNGIKLNTISRHLLGLFQGQRGAAVWRRYISQNAHKPGANAGILEEALNLIANY